MRGEKTKRFSALQLVTVTWLTLKGCTRQEDLGMTKYLVGIDVVKRRDIQEMRKREEHYNFLEHKGARQLGAQPAGCGEDPVCDWCDLTNPFSKGPVLLEWDPGETTGG